MTGAPDTKDNILFERKNTLVVEALGQEFLFSTNGELWCHGKVDDVVDTNLPLALIYGLYKLGSQAEAEISSGRGWKFELKSAKDRVQCSSEVKMMHALRGWRHWGKSSQHWTIPPWSVMTLSPSSSKTMNIHLLPNTMRSSAQRCDHILL